MGEAALGAVLSGRLHRFREVASMSQSPIMSTYSPRELKRLADNAAAARGWPSRGCTWHIEVYCSGARLVVRPAEPGRFPGNARHEVAL